VLIVVELLRWDTHERHVVHNKFHEVSSVGLEVAAVWVGLTDRAILLLDWVCVCGFHHYTTPTLVLASLTRGEYIYAIGFNSTPPILVLFYWDMSVDMVTACGQDNNDSIPDSVLGPFSLPYVWTNWTSWDSLSSAPGE
jgi:hypothetical protein